MNQPSGRGGPAIPTGTEGNGRGCQQAACVVCALSGRVVALLLHCCGCRATVGRCCLQGSLDSAVCVLSSSVTSGIELSCVCCCCAREVAFWYSLGPPSHGAPALKPAALGTACGPDLPEFLWGGGALPFCEPPPQPLAGSSPRMGVSRPTPPARARGRIALLPAGWLPRAKQLWRFSRLGASSAPTHPAALPPTQPNTPPT